MAKYKIYVSIHFSLKLFQQCVKHFISLENKKNNFSESRIKHYKVTAKKRKYKY